MNTKEHLAAIVAKCRANIALAEKRTSGEWLVSSSILVCTTEAKIISQGGILHGLGVPMDECVGNAAYIADCAGAAEAGWRSTIAAIEGLEKIRKNNQGGAASDGRTRNEIIGIILAAWPEDIL